MSSIDRIAYKPLFISPVNGADPDEDQDELDGQPWQQLRQQVNTINIATTQLLNLKHLRLILYLAASILFIIFIAQLGSSGSQITTLEGLRAVPLPSPSAYNLSSPSFGQPNRPKQHQQLAHSDQSSTPFTLVDDESREDQSVTTRHSEQTHILGLPETDLRPQYDSYLSSVIKEHNSLSAIPDPRNGLEATDDLHYPAFEGQQQASGDRWWTLGSRLNDQYVTVTNYIRASKSFNYNSSITLTTQATLEFIHHTLELCKRWDGPISIAVFTPGQELPMATILIKFMRQCLPKPLSVCIKDKVTWHFVYNKVFGPEPSALKYPKYHLDSVSYPLFVDQDLCPKFPGPEPIDLIEQFYQQLSLANKLLPVNFRQKNQLVYPINVLRNTARLAAKTHYLLASDVELYPSVNMVPALINYLNNHNVPQEYKGVEKFVFALPIFEVSAKSKAPKTKQELVNLIGEKNAIFFHRYVCDACQDFPNRWDWLHTDKYGEKNYRAGDMEIVIFNVTRREKTRDQWEPIFIGTQQEPLYNDRLTWDGRRDKMGQMFEMCLEDYYLLIPGNAFLVHSPGIKKIDKNDVLRRVKHIRKNNAIYETNMSMLRHKYASTKNIDKC